MREQVQITFQRILSLQGQLISREAVENHKQEELFAAKMEFERGVKTLKDLIEIRLDYENAMLDRIQIGYELERFRFELLALTGHLAKGGAINTAIKQNSE